MILTPDDYTAETGRSATLDVGSAMSAALARLVARAVIKTPGNAGTPTKFSEVLTDWASFNNRNVYPTACVISEAEIRYDESHLTPNLLRETWARQGERGMGLYQEAEGTTDLKVFLRAQTKKERSAVILAVEELFSKPANPERGSRYGVLEEMPEYWGMRVRLAAEGVTKLDSSESASKNRWEAFLRVSAQAPKVKLDVVAPMSITIQTTVDDDAGD